MSMVTSCPECTTTFRISPEQLKQREGKVRCGQCSSVFDAFKTLASLPDEVSSGGSSADEARVREQAETPAEKPSVSPDDTASPEAQGKLDIGPIEPEEPAVGRSASLTASIRSRRALWIAGVVMLLVALALQLLYVMRDHVAAAWPAARPALERACARFGCVVTLPRRTEQLAIESSDLQADPKQANRLVLVASLRNRGSGVVAHPSLELTLTNAQDQPLARRVFQPSDYLSDAATIKAGMPGMSEVGVRIVLDTGDLKPAGYRLFLFYP